jgi:hypothetical protein
MKNMIKAGKTGMGAINLQVRSSAEIPEEPTKLLRTSGDTFQKFTFYVVCMTVRTHITHVFMYTHWTYNSYIMNLVVTPDVLLKTWLAGGHIRRKPDF